MRNESEAVHVKCGAGVRAGRSRDVSCVMGSPCGRG